MKRYLAVLLIIGLFLSCTHWPLTESPPAFDSIVTGQNNSAQDVQAVQEVVDKGGTVLLKGIFDFGAKGKVKIKNDVAIWGQRDSKGQPSTKIIGGFWAFHTALPTTQLPLPGPGPKIKIKNIHFDGVTWSPMHFPFTSGAEITGNKITNVQPFKLPIKWKGGDFVLVQTGIILGTRFAHKEKFLPDAVTGNLVVENNMIDLTCENPKITMGHGIFFPWTSGAIITVKGNTLRNVSRNSIESLDNYLDGDGRGSVTITGNDIVTPAEGCLFPSPITYPSGIVAGWFFDRAGSTDPKKYSKITITKNNIQANGALSSGIISLSDATLIQDNHIELTGGSKAKGITQFGSHGNISRNKIRGAGAWAIGAISWKFFKGSSNTLEKNDLTGFNESNADFYCTGNNNTFIGSECKVVDKGEGNKILVKK
jgi:Leucine-rich repeat (LRR) protein